MDSLKRHAHRAISVAFVASMATAAACSHNDGSVFIAGVLAPPTSSQNGVCLFQANPSGPFQSGGVMDVALADRYSPEILIGNQLVPRGDNANLRVETNRFIIQGTVVHITDARGGTLPNGIGDFTIQGGGEVDPAVGGTPGYTAFSPQIISSQVAGFMRDVFGNARSNTTRRLIAKFKVFGATTGGVSMESMQFEFPVETCFGCLVVYPAGSSDPALPLPNCRGASGGSSTIVVPCAIGSDQSVDCRLCQGNPACLP